MLADQELHSEIHSTAGDHDLIVKHHVEDGVDAGRFIGETVHAIDGIRDTATLITYKAF